MERQTMTIEEAREKKAKAIIALKFGLLEVGSLAYWVALGDREIEID